MTCKYKYRIRLGYNLVASLGGNLLVFIFIIIIVK